MAKNRVAPLKSLTLPRLELMAALVGARLATHLQDSLPATNITLWSDSQIVLHWLSTSKTLKKFIANRVTEIRDLTDAHSWRYCPTHDNPADLLTRGISADKFMNNNLWEAGPTWLCDSSRWPTWNHDSMLVQTIIDEQTTSNDEQTSNVRKQQNTTENATCMHNIIDVDRYSRYSKLLRVTAYVLRFVHNCRVQQHNRRAYTLSTQELEDAEKVCLRDCQSTAFPDVISNIKSRSTRVPLVETTSTIY